MGVIRTLAQSKNGPNGPHQPGSTRRFNASLRSATQLFLRKFQGRSFLTALGRRLKFPLAMPHPFALSYARLDANIDEHSRESDPHFEEFLKRLNQRVRHLTGRVGFVDRTNFRPGQEWPDELAEALRTTQTMVCLYSPSYFASDYCGKEMQVLLDRRRNYIRVNAGKKPANIIPVLWHPAPRQIPKTLPEIEYHAPNLDPNTHGAWNLGDDCHIEDLRKFADAIAIRVRDAAYETPLDPLPERPRMQAVRSAFQPPPLPLPEFDAPGQVGGPDTVTFVYPSLQQWDAWPWAPPAERAVLHLATAVAKGNDMESTQLTFDLADAHLTARLELLRRKNNVVILLLDGPSLGRDDLRARMRDYDQPEHSSFAAIVVTKARPEEDLRPGLSSMLPSLSKRAAPYFHLVEGREKFSDIVGQALNELKLAVVRAPQTLNVINNASEFQSLPAVNGPGALLAVT
jgi:TIR domain